MIQSGILNPRILELIARVRHTNMLVIADQGFPSWPTVETVDISLVSGVPTVLQMLDALKVNFLIGQAYMASEFLDHNDHSIIARFNAAFGTIPLIHEAHEAVFKPRIPGAIGLIRTGDPTPYSNMILVSA